MRLIEIVARRWSHASARCRHSRRLAGPALLVVALLAATAGVAGQEIPTRPLGPAPPPPVGDVLWTAEELLTAWSGGGWTVYDARPAEVAAGAHLPGARPLPPQLRRSPAEVLAAFAGAGARVCGQQGTAVYGDDPATVARAFWNLSGFGCAAKLLAGGVAAWRAAGGEVETGDLGGGAAPAALAGPPARDRSAGNALSARELFATLGGAGQVVLDLRSGDGSIPRRWPESFRRGHVPGSLPFDLTSLLAEDGGWPDPRRARDILAGFGPRSISPLPLSSTFVLLGAGPGDERPEVGFTLLRILGLDAVVVPEGWQGWRGAGLPVVEIVEAGELRRRLLAAGADLAADQPVHGLVMVDLREARDHALRHLPGAISLPPSETTGERLLAVLERIWPGMEASELPVALYCYGRDCTRSWEASVALARQGFTRLLWFRGGMDEWRQAELPTPGSLADGTAGL